MSAKPEEVFINNYNNVEEINRYVSSLEELSVGSSATVIKVPDDTLLAPLGIRDNKRIKVENIQPLGGPIVIDAAGRKIAIGRDVAKEIKVGNIRDV